MSRSSAYAASNGAKRPVAVVVPAADSRMVTQALVDWTNARVGKQQRICDVVWRRSLPRNANGKVLKRELRHELADRLY